MKSNIYLVYFGVIWAGGGHLQNMLKKKTKKKKKKRRKRREVRGFFLRICPFAHTGCGLGIVSKD